MHTQSLDTASTIETFAAREVELGTGFLTSTDHGTLQATRTVYDLCTSGKFKGKLSPILGIEGYFRDDSCEILTELGVTRSKDGTFRDNFKYGHITMHCLDEDAYSALSVAISDADLRAEKHGSERKPLFTWKHLEELGRHNITAGSSCLVGMVGRHLLRGDTTAATRYYERVRSTFKPGNFFVEVFPHSCDREWESKVVVTDDAGVMTEFRPWKKLKTHGGELKAEELAKECEKSQDAAVKKHIAVLEVMDNRAWRVLEIPAKIKSVEKHEGWVMNECTLDAPNGDVQARANNFVIALANKYGDPIQISGDSHFAYPKEHIVQDVRLAQSGNWRMFNSYHRRSSADAWEYFKNHGVKESDFEKWIENGYAWAERFKGFKFSPRNALPTKFYPQDTLKHTMSLIQKHGRMDWKNPALVERLRTEIQLLHKNGTVDLLPYFMVVEDALNQYHKRGVLTGPGRGSAAGVELAYLLGITHREPMRHNLSLDRFLTLDRIQTGKMPDIDNDLSSRDILVGADEQGGWLKERFGDCVAQISAITTMKLKSAIKDTFRAMDRRNGSSEPRVPPEIEFICSKLPAPPQGISDKDYVFGYKDVDGQWVQGLVETNTVLQGFIKKYPEEWEIVSKTIGLARQATRHPCGFLIANQPIQEFIPLMTVGGVRVTSFPAGGVEAAGGLKIDFLTVNSLNDIGRAIQLIRQRHARDLLLTDDEGVQYGIVDGKKVPAIRLVPFNGSRFDVWDLPEDSAVYKDICEGKVETVFQFDAGAARQGLRNFEPRNGEPPLKCIEDLAAFTALDRPGPLDAFVTTDAGEKHNMLVEFARRSKGQKAVGALDVLDELIPETRSIIIYQEQCQSIFQQVGKTTALEANSFRYRFSKKKMVEVDKNDRPVFMRGAVETIGKEAAEKLWNMLYTFAGYSFNKSIDGDVILPYGGGAKALKDFHGGETVRCVDDRGEIQDTTVVALHDHGILEGFEVTFDDGFTTTTSINHKFLTPRGQVPLIQIISSDIPVLCRDVEPNSCRTLPSPPQVSAVSTDSSKDWAHRVRTNGTMRTSVRNAKEVLGAPEEMSDVLGNQKTEYYKKNERNYKQTRSEGGDVQNRQAHFGSSRYSASAGIETAGVAKRASRADAENMEFCQGGSQTIKERGMDSTERSCIGLERGSDPLRIGHETGGLCKSGPYVYDRGGRLLALLGSETKESSGQRSDAKYRSNSTPECDLGPTSRCVLRDLERTTEGRVASMAYSDAPLSSTGDLVLRKIVRIRSVGPRHMYDLEVAHPKHNFLLLNGVVTSNSHAVCYVTISYACAWLKHHYPLEWWTAVLSNATKNDIDEKFWGYCSHLIDLPDIQLSQKDFAVQNARIRAPLSLLHGLGEKAHQQLLEGAPYTSIKQFLESIEAWRVAHPRETTKKDKKTGETKKVMSKGVSALNATVIQNLIVSGVMDSLFPEKDELGAPTTVQQRLTQFMFAFKEVFGNRKMTAIGSRYDLDDPVVRLQLRKKILPAYSTKLVPLMSKVLPWKFEGNRLLIYTNERNHTYETTGVLGECNEKWRIIGPKQYEALMTLGPMDADLEVAMIGYVVEDRRFEYTQKSSGTKKSACELTLDVDGTRIHVVKWPSKDGLPSSFASTLTGSVVACTFMRSRGSDTFFLGNAMVLRPALTDKPDDEESK
jgi:DNA polymerase III alpha subunit